MSHASCPGLRHARQSSSKSWPTLASWPWVSYGLWTAASPETSLPGLVEPRIGLEQPGPGGRLCSWRCQAYLAALRFWAFSPARLHLSLRLAAVSARRPFLQQLATLLDQQQSAIWRFYCARSPGRSGGIALLSGLIWVFIIAEYWITLRFLGLDFDLFQSHRRPDRGPPGFSNAPARGRRRPGSRAVFCAPGAGRQSRFGLSISLVIRARDILLGLIGLALLARYTHPYPRLARHRQIQPES
jgi:hypothetical protein